jgi:hypothetical protein
MEPSLSLDHWARRVRDAYILVSGKNCASLRKISKNWKEIASFLISRNIRNALTYCLAIRRLKGKIYPNFLKSSKIYDEVENFLSVYRRELLLELSCQLNQFINEVRYYQRFYRLSEDKAIGKALERSSWLNPVLAIKVHILLGLPIPDDLKSRAVRLFCLAPDIYERIGVRAEEFFSNF